MAQTPIHTKELFIRIHQDPALFLKRAKFFSERGKKRAYSGSSTTLPPRKCHLTTRSTFYASKSEGTQSFLPTIESKRDGKNVRSTHEFFREVGLFSDELVLVE
jgi:hypothetical protein